MKRQIIFLTIILALVLALPAFADDYTDVMNKGKLVFGTAPEYIPFVFYDDADQLTGIDVALMQEVGRRMGVKVEVVDMAFDGLMDALNIGQVDAIGGALSKTEDRAETIDFSRVYYKGEALFITKNTTPKPAQIDLADFRGKRIGVQRGTSFDQWVKTNLVMAGYAGTRDVYSYSKVADAVKAMDRGDVDFVLMDQDVYEDKYKGSGKYQIYYNGFAEENYAFGLRKDSSLTLAVNGHLANMMKDGTAQKIANKFFSMNFNEASPAINRPSQIVTPNPYNPPAPVTCVNSMVFVKDVTIKDGHQVSPNERFTKTWRIYNNGSCTWNSNYSFVYVSGDQMNGRNVVIPAIVQPGQTVDVSVSMMAPRENGTYRGYWQMRSPQGQNFGQTVWAKVRVKGSPHPVPTQRPYPDPTTVPGPSIQYFYADPATMPAGQTPTIYWAVSRASTVLIQIDGKTVYNGSDLTGNARFKELGDGARHEVKLLARNVTDDAFASFWYKSSEIVPTNLPRPDIYYFYADPESLPAGQSPNVIWAVKNAATVLIKIDGYTVYDGSDQSGSRTFGELADGNSHTVELLARNVTDDSSASFYYQPTHIEPTEIPVEPPYVAYFYPDYYSGNAGDIPTVYWSAPGAQMIEISVDGGVVYSGNAPTGSGRWDILGVVGNHNVELLARNITDDAFSSFQYVTNFPGGDEEYIDTSWQNDRPWEKETPQEEEYMDTSWQNDRPWEQYSEPEPEPVVVGYNEDTGWNSGYVEENVDYGAPSWADVPAPTYEEPVYEEPAPAPQPEPVYEEPAPAPQPEPVYEEPAPAPQPEPVYEEPTPEPTKTPEPEPEMGFFLGAMEEGE